MKVVVWITDVFEGFHRWEDAPDAVSFLRNMHRHLFHVKVGVLVIGLDREREFFLLKRKLSEKLDQYRGQSFSSSCEIIATEILKFMDAEYVSVSEDKENGATVTRTSALPAWSTEGKCFVGTEAEGPYRGLQTLFVPGSVDPDRVARLLGKYIVQAVYYGAGNDRVLRQDTLCLLADGVVDGYKVCTVEVGAHSMPLPAKIERMCCTVGFGVKGLRFRKWFEKDRVVWEDSMGRQWITSVHDPLFLADMYVE